MIDLQVIAGDIADAIVHLDKSGECFRAFRPGAGPFGEPQLVRKIAETLNKLPMYGLKVRTKRTPDLLIPNEWAIEFKIARPYGDNGNEAEDWSVNLLHPYPGNISTIGDCYKLSKLPGPEHTAIVVIGYEHDPPNIDLTPLIRSFELITEHVAGIGLSQCIEVRRSGLLHPVHQAVRVCAWEVAKAGQRHEGRLPG